MGIATFCFFGSALPVVRCSQPLQLKSVHIVDFAFLYSSAHLRVRAFVFLPTVEYRGRVSALALSPGASSLYMARFCQQRRRQATCKQSAISGLGAKSQLLVCSHF